MAASAARATSDGPAAGGERRRRRLRFGESRVTALTAGTRRAPPLGVRVDVVLLFAVAIVAGQTAAREPLAAWCAAAGVLVVLARCVRLRWLACALACFALGSWRAADTLERFEVDACGSASARRRRCGGHGAGVASPVRGVRARFVAIDELFLRASCPGPLRLLLHGDHGTGRGDPSSERSVAPINCFAIWTRATIAERGAPRITLTVPRWRSTWSALTRPASLVFRCDALARRIWPRFRGAQAWHARS